MKSPPKELGIVGFFGAFAWILFAFLYSVYGSFSPDAQGPPPITANAFLCFILPLLTFLFYATLSEHWSYRAMLLTGLLLHALLGLAIALLVASTDLGLLIVLPLLMGPIIWIRFLGHLRQEDTEQVGGPNRYR